MKNTDDVEIDQLDEFGMQLIRYFYKGTLNFSINPEDIKHLNWNLQSKFLDATLNTERVKKYPVSTEFLRLFLKKVINALEKNDQEVHDDLYSALCGAMHQTNREFCYRHYLIGNDVNNIITVKETRNMVVNGTTGLKTWEAALLLSDWILCNKNIFENKNILELGSGVGFTGITTGKLCNVKSLTFTDCHDDVLETICDNIHINLPSFVESNDCGMNWFKDEVKSMCVTNLDWFDMNLPEKVAPDILIGADIVYDPSILIPLSNVMKAFCKRNPSLEVYIASIIRNEVWCVQVVVIVCRNDNTSDKMDFQYAEISFSSHHYFEWDESVHKSLLKITIK